MRKLIIRQQKKASTLRAALPNWLGSSGLFWGLLLGVVVGGLFYQQYQAKQATLHPIKPALTSASDMHQRARYLTQVQQLEVMNINYHQLVEQLEDDYKGHTALAYKAQLVLDHLGILEKNLQALNLSADERATNQEQYLYYQDYWQAKLHFHQLRMGRLQDMIVPIVTQENTALQHGVKTAKAEHTTDLEVKAKVSPPILPPGVCALGAEISCKPEL